jgi:orotidine-5'-phosphate decarboxylase
MGSDSVKPFLGFEGKWVILLALTSNQGSLDFQFTESEGMKLYEKVLTKAQEWGNAEEMMFVVGATRAEEIANVRKLVPNHFFLVPGVGAQGGSLDEVVKFGANDQCGLLVNSSRGIIYASNGLDFAIAAKSEALKIQSEMEVHIQRNRW